MGIALLIISAAMAWVSVILLFVWVSNEWEWGNRSLLRRIESRLDHGHETNDLGQQNSGPLAVSRIEETVALFKEGYPCSRVLLKAYGPALRLSRGEAIETGLRFARDMNASETCGAVTGAFTILAAYAHRTCSKASDRESQTRQCLAEFSKRFKARHHTVLCQEFLARNAGGTLRFGKAGASPAAPVCCEVIHDASEILEELLPPSPAAGQTPVKLAA